MEQLLWLLWLIPAAVSSKFVYVDEWLMWSDAQRYCREHHTDLAPAASARDIQLLHRLVAPRYFGIWIGLQRDAADEKKWLWSGGAEVRDTFWAQGEPNNWLQSEENGILSDYEWNDMSGLRYYTFACFQATVVRERMTWEEALEHCRGNHRDLASVVSDTDMLLIQRELDKDVTTESVWTGLRMLMDDWLWVDGQPLEYQAWGARDSPTCPTIRRCGALRRKTAGGTSIYHRSEPEWEWVAHKCERKFHFVCY